MLAQNTRRSQYTANLKGWRDDPRQQYLEDREAGFLGNASIALGQMVGQTAPAMVPIAGLPYMFGTQASLQTDDGLRKGMSYQDAVERGVLYGGLTAGVERLSMGVFGKLGFADKIANKAMIAVGSKIAPKLTSKYLSSAGAQYFGRSATGGIGEIAEEAIEAVGQYALNPFVAEKGKTTLDEQVEQFTTWASKPSNLFAVFAFSGGVNLLNNKAYNDATQQYRDGIKEVLDHGGTLEIAHHARTIENGQERLEYISNAIAQRAKQDPTAFKAQLKERGQAFLDANRVTHMRATAGYEYARKQGMMPSVTKEGDMYKVAPPELDQTNQSEGPDNYTKAKTQEQEDGSTLMTEEQLNDYLSITLTEGHAQLVTQLQELLLNDTIMENAGKEGIIIEEMPEMETEATLANMQELIDDLRLTMQAAGVAEQDINNTIVPELSPNIPIGVMENITRAAAIRMETAKARGEAAEGQRFASAAYNVSFTNPVTGLMNHVVRVAKGQERTGNLWEEIAELSLKRWELDNKDFNHQDAGNELQALQKELNQREPSAPQFIQTETAPTRSDVVEALSQLVTSKFMLQAVEDPQGDMPAAMHDYAQMLLPYVQMHQASMNVATQVNKLLNQGKLSPKLETALQEMLQGVERAQLQNIRQGAEAQTRLDILVKEQEEMEAHRLTTAPSVSQMQAQLGQQSSTTNTTPINSESNFSIIPIDNTQAIPYNELQDKQTHDWKTDQEKRRAYEEAQGETYNGLFATASTSTNRGRALRDVQGKTDKAGDSDSGANRRTEGEIRARRYHEGDEGRLHGQDLQDSRESSRSELLSGLSPSLAQLDCRTFSFSGKQQKQAQQQKLYTGELLELPQTPEGAKAFSDAIRAGAQANKYGECVHVYEDAEYQQMRLFLTPDGMSGVALKEGGDMVSVFRHPAQSKAKGNTIRSLIALAISSGATKGDCYGVYLAEICGELGFRPVIKDAFTTEFIEDPDSIFLNEEKMKGAFEDEDGKPPVYYLVYAGDPYNILDNYDAGYSFDPNIIPDTTGTAHDGDTWQESVEKQTRLLEGEQEKHRALDAHFHEGKPLLALNGEESNLNARRWHLVRTQEFLLWFGDWMRDPENASKVIDENGEPLVVYHGSFEKDITKFKTQGFFGSLASGAYFTSDKEIAEGYSIDYDEDVQGEIYPVFLNIRKPFYADFGGNYWDDASYAVSQNYELEGKGIAITDDISIYSRKKGYHGAYMENVIDSVGEADNESTVYTIYHPNQVKSASKGTRFSSNPDINYSIITETAQQQAQRTLAPTLRDMRARAILRSVEGSMKRWQRSMDKSKNPETAARTMGEINTLLAEILHYLPAQDKLKIKQYQKMAAALSLALENGKLRSFGNLSTEQFAELKAELEQALNDAGLSQDTQDVATRIEQAKALVESTKQALEEAKAEVELTRHSYKESKIEEDGKAKKDKDERAELKKAGIKVYGKAIVKTTPQHDEAINDLEDARKAFTRAKDELKAAQDLLKESRVAKKELPELQADLTRIFAEGKLSELVTLILKDAHAHLQAQIKKEFTQKTFTHLERMLPKKGKNGKLVLGKTSAEDMRYLQLMLAMTQAEPSIVERELGNLEAAVERLSSDKNTPDKSEPYTYAGVSLIINAEDAAYLANAWQSYGNLASKDLASTEAALTGLLAFANGSRQAWKAAQKLKKDQAQRVADELVKAVNRKLKNKGKPEVDAQTVKEVKILTGRGKKLFSEHSFEIYNLSQTVASIKNGLDPKRDAEIIEFIDKWCKDLEHAHTDLNDRGNYHNDTLLSVVAQAIGTNVKTKGWKKAVKKWLVDARKISSTTVPKWSNLKTKLSLSAEDVLLYLSKDAEAIEQRQARAKEAAAADKVNPTACGYVSGSQIETMRKLLQQRAANRKQDIDTYLASYQGKNIHVELESSKREQDIKLTKMQAVYQVLLWEQTRYQSNFETHGYRPESIEAIYKIAGEDGKALADMLREHVHQNGLELASTYERITGNPFPAEENYFVARFDTDQTDKAGELPETGGMNANAPTYKSLILRKAHAAAPDLTVDALGATLATIAEQDNYIATAELSARMHGLLSIPRAHHALIAHMGAHHVGLLNSWLRELDTAGVAAAQTLASSSRWIGGIQKMQAFSFLSWKPTVWAKQVTGVVNFLRSEKMGIMNIIKYGHKHLTNGHFKLSARIHCYRGRSYKQKVKYSDSDSDRLLTTRSTRIVHLI